MGTNPQSAKNGLVYTSTAYEHQPVFCTIWYGHKPWCTLIGPCMDILPKYGHIPCVWPHPRLFMYGHPPSLTLSCLIILLCMVFHVWTHPKVFHVWTPSRFLMYGPPPQVFHIWTHYKVFHVWTHPKVFHVWKPSRFLMYGHPPRFSTYGHTTRFSTYGHTPRSFMYGHTPRFFMYGHTIRFPRMDTL